MSTRAKRLAGELLPLKKCPTGIPGLDEISGGGLPKGRTTIVCGGPGCGKTMLGIEFLVRGATEFNEPGVLMAFEETPRDIATNVASLGFDIQALARRKELYLDFLSVEPSEIKESGDYDLPRWRRSALNASCSTRWKHSFPVSPIRGSCAPNSGAVSLAERSWFDHRHHCRTEAKAISLAMGWRNTYPIA